MPALYIAPTKAFYVCGINNILPTRRNDWHRTTCRTGRWKHLLQGLEARQRVALPEPAHHVSRDHETLALDVNRGVIGAPRSMMNNGPNMRLQRAVGDEAVVAHRSTTRSRMYHLAVISPGP